MRTDMRRCTKCEILRPSDDFSLKVKKTGERRSVCRSCCASAQRAHIAACKADGRCPDCGRTKEAGFIRCAECRTSRGVALKARREEAARSGRCANCCANKSGRYRLCSPCRKTFAFHNRKQKTKIKSAVFDHYGHACSCCGEDHPAFLTIDHINGGGNQHRKEIGGAAQLYPWLVQNSFPDGFRALCFNCNCGRRFTGGICPHQTGKDAAV